MNRWRLWHVTVSLRSADSPKRLVSSLGLEQFCIFHVVLSVHWHWTSSSTDLPPLVLTSQVEKSHGVWLIKPFACASSKAADTDLGDIASTVSLTASITHMPCVHEGDGGILLPPVTMQWGNV